MGTRTQKNTNNNRKAHQMNLNQAGIDLIKEFEGLNLTAYPDPASGGEPWTIGYGSTGPGIIPGVVWTQEQADERLTSDLTDTANQISKAIRVNLNDNQFSAIVSLAYNVGVGAVVGSTLLVLVNNGHNDLASSEFPKWDHAGGQVMQGLLNRRLAEQVLFNS